MTAGAACKCEGFLYHTAKFSQRLPVTQTTCSEPSPPIHTKAERRAIFVCLLLACGVKGCRVPLAESTSPKPAHRNVGGAETSMVHSAQFSYLELLKVLFWVICMQQTSPLFYLTIKVPLATTLVRIGCARVATDLAAACILWHELNVSGISEGIVTKVNLFEAGLDSSRCHRFVRRLVICLFCSPDSCKKKYPTHLIYYT